MKRVLEETELCKKELPLRYWFRLVLAVLNDSTQSSITITFFIV